jgi:CrcB protein
VNKAILIGAGGFVGAVLRYSVGGWVQVHSPGTGFPYGTLAVNAVGCATMGLLSTIAENQNLVSTDAQHFLLVGMLGAFTTFSTFSNETMALFRAGDELRALLNVGAHLALGLSMIWLGRAAGRWLGGGLVW